MNKKTAAAVSFLVMGLAVSGCGASIRSAKTGESGLLTEQVASLEERVGTLNQQVEQLAKRQELLERGAQGEQTAGLSSQAGELAKTLTSRNIQTALKAAGYYDGPVDGKIGPKTRQAIRDFQRDNGLKTDGVVGRKTAALLAKYLN
ncbi:MAG: peptidoglycan-binding protein [Candidatus Omnitrophica bacterium]|nr:peptidoglycan-binding protein [Candidatus Omnitrophota bacterium]